MAGSEVPSSIRKKPSEAPLTVAVRGEDILFLGLAGGPTVLTLRAAAVSARRIHEAIAVAQGRLPQDAWRPGKSSGRRE